MNTKKKKNKKREHGLVVTPADARMLAINPGSRYLGLAVFDDAQLLDWRVRVVNGRNLHSKLGHITALIDDLCLRYQPQILVLKRLHPRRSSPMLDQITSEIRRLCMRRRLRVCRLSIQNISYLLSTEGYLVKPALIDYVVTSYPTLQRELSIERSAKNPYHIRMFEAVALGMACRRKLERN